MHLRRMELGALGPFAGTHTVDFAELGASGLYLLEGPTGAGKSTLIDAVVFALYGKVASEATSDDRLRSGYAADDVDTFVDLVFETGSGVYRVRRQPERLRAKRRGTGTTKQQASIKLWRLTDPDDLDGGELVSSRLDEASAEIQRAIGLDRAQFVQTIVLPQGEFASFLRAKPEERRGLLQKVFGTDVYERVQDQLGAMRREAQAAVESARAAVAGAAAHFVGAASLTDDVDFAAGRARAAAGTDGPDGPDRPDDAAAPDDPAAAPDGTGTTTDRLATASELRALGSVAHPEVVTAAGAHATALAHEAERAARADREARGHLEVARAAFEDARALAAAVARRDTLRAEHAQLLTGTDAHTEAVARRDLARRAAVLAGLLDGADEAGALARTTQDRLRRLQDDAPEVAGLDEEELVAAREALAGEAARLARLEPIERGLPARRTEVAREEGALAADSAERAALGAEMAARPALRAALEESIAELGDPGVEAATARAELAAVTERREAADRADALELELAAAGERAVAAVDAARRAVAAEADLRARRLAGMAGELALELEPGRPCPVCGGVEHPAAAALAVDHPGADEVAASEARRVTAERAAGRAASEVTGLVERVAAQRSRAGDGTRTDLDAQLASITGRVADADAAVARLADLQRALSTHLTDTDVLLDRTRTLDVSVARRVTRIESLVTALEADHKEVDAARAGAPTVAARLAEIAAHVGTLTDLARATADATAARKDLRRRTRELDVALAQQGFADAAAARAAVLAPGDLRALDEAITAFAAALARVESGLADPALMHLPDRVEVDVAGAREACGTAERDAAEAARQATLAARCASAAHDALEHVRAAVALHTAARDAAAPVTRMADLAAASGGDNAKRLTLATYVLTRRFEDVVAAANDRLAGMSDGRFELVRSDEREDVRSQKRGLAMKVVDHRIEVERDPRTLSGGETFYVSLCLALGMADVVTAEAGGIDLGTLFVDEGFGTLDPETLEAVLAELGKLRAGGRVVGVVSHVEALKQSIAERIEIRRLPDGSSTLTVRAG